MQRIKQSSMPSAKKKTGLAGPARLVVFIFDLDKQQLAVHGHTQRHLCEGKLKLHPSKIISCLRTCKHLQKKQRGSNRID